MARWGDVAVAAGLLVAVSHDPVRAEGPGPSRLVRPYDQAGLDAAALAAVRDAAGSILRRARVRIDWTGCMMPEASDLPALDPGCREPLRRGEIMVRVVNSAGNPGQRPG